MREINRSPPPRRQVWPWLQGLVLVATVAFVYVNTLAAPFIFDDLPAIVDNPSIRSFWRPTGAVPAGSSVDGRPVVNFTFAANYAAAGLSPWSYRLTNLVMHAAAGLVLWRLLRRILTRPAIPDWLACHAEAVGWGAAWVWALHPLQTESVTCVVQRTESLAGLICLGAFYAFARATDPAETRPGQWLGVTLAFTWLGMATKETVAALPLLLVLYDRTFGAGSFREGWRRRRGWYVGFALSWLLLGGLMISTEGRGGTVTWQRDVTPWMSLLTQSRAIATYLKLSLWPHPLVLDYGSFVTDTVTAWREVAPQFLLVGGLAMAGGYALIRRPVAGFVAAWFFLNLAPSSSLVPLLSQMRAEHRMYLPLVALVVPAVALLWRKAGRAAPWMMAGWAVALGGATIARNHDYRTAVAIWSDTVDKQPGNPRAQYNLGLASEAAGDSARAERAYREAVRLKPVYPEAGIALATVLLRRGAVDTARPLLAKMEHEPLESSNMYNNLGQAFLLAGEVEKGIRQFEQALRLDPINAEAHNNLGYALAVKGRLPEAISHLRESTTLAPQSAAYRNLGAALLQAGQIADSIAALREALRLEPTSVAARFSLGGALVAAGRTEEAFAEYAQVVAADPAHVGGWFNLGVLARRAGRIAEARLAFQRVLVLEPANRAAAVQLENLGIKP